MSSGTEKRNGHPFPRRALSGTVRGLSVGHRGRTASGLFTTRQPTHYRNHDPVSRYLPDGCNHLHESHHASEYVGGEVTTRRANSLPRQPTTETMQNEITEALDRSPFDPTWTTNKGRRMGNPWGQSMGLMFDLCAYIFHETEYCTPAHWEYRAGGGGEIEELKQYKPHLYDALDAADIETLIRTGNVLHRYTRALDRAGLSY